MRYLPNRKNLTLCADYAENSVQEQLQVECLHLYQEVMLHETLHQLPEVFRQDHWLMLLPQMQRFVAQLSDQTVKPLEQPACNYLPLHTGFVIGQPFHRQTQFFASLLTLAQLQELDDQGMDFSLWSNTSEQLLQKIMHIKHSDDAQSRFGLYIAMQLWSQSSIWYKASAHLLMQKPVKVGHDFFVQVERCTLKDLLSDWLVKQENLPQLQQSLVTAQQVLNLIAQFWQDLAQQQVLH